MASEYTQSLLKQLDDANTELQAFKDNHDAFIQQFQATDLLGNEQAGWRAKAEGEYRSQLATLQNRANNLQGQLTQAQRLDQQADKTAATAPKTVVGKDGTIYTVGPDGTITPQGGNPAPESGSAIAAQARSQAGYYDAAAQAQRASAAKTEAEAANVGATTPSEIARNQAQAGLYGAQTAAQGLNAQAAMLQAQVNQGQLTLNQAKQKWDEQYNLLQQQASAEQAQMLQGNTRANVAQGYFNNALDFVGKLAPNLPKGSDLGGQAFAGLLQAAPLFQELMGGAPLPPQAGQTLSMIAALADQKGIPVSQAASQLTGFMASRQQPAQAGSATVTAAPGVTQGVGLPSFVAPPASGNSDSSLAA